MILCDVGEGKLIIVFWFGGEVVVCVSPPRIQPPRWHGPVTTQPIVLLAVLVKSE